MNFFFIFIPELTFASVKNGDYFLNFCIKEDPNQTLTFSSTQQTTTFPIPQFTGNSTLKEQKIYSIQTHLQQSINIFLEQTEDKIWFHFKKFNPEQNESFVLKAEIRDNSGILRTITDKYSLQKDILFDRCFYCFVKSFQISAGQISFCLLTMDDFMDSQKPVNPPSIVSEIAAPLSKLSTLSSPFMKIHYFLPKRKFSNQVPVLNILQFNILM